MRAEKYAEQIREEERTRVQEEKDHVIKERERNGEPLWRILLIRLENSDGQE